MMFIFYCSLLLSLFSSAQSDELTSDELPIADEYSRKTQDGPYFGLMFGTGWVQDYPGAAQGRPRYLLIPTYKSRFLTIDRHDGVKSDLVERNRVQLSLSFSFLFPTQSKDIPIRSGMPDLAWTFQLGPELRIELMHNNFHTMYFRMPLRFVVNTDFYHTFDYLDWNFAPGFRNIFNLGNKYGEIITRFEVDFASEKYNKLFYQVDEQYATPTRPAYNARGGFMEYIAGINYSYYNFFPWTFFGGTNIYLLQNSVNENSPLLERKTNYSFFAGVIRYF